MLYLHGCWIKLGRAIDAVASAVRVRSSRHAAGARHEVLRARARLQRLLRSCIRLGSRSACPGCLPWEADSLATSSQKQEEGTDDDNVHIPTIVAEGHSS